MSESQVSAKTVSSTAVTLSYVVEPTDVNFHGKMFGGALLAQIDLCAYTCSTRFAGHVTVTASFDRVDFHEPIEVGEVITLKGLVAFAGRTSVEVVIEVYSENILTGKSRHTNTARVTMVALQDGRPTAVPKLICDSADEKVRYLQAKLRREIRNRYREEREELDARIERATDDELDAWMRLENVEAAIDAAT